MDLLLPSACVALLLCRSLQRKQQLQNTLQRTAHMLYELQTNHKSVWSSLNDTQGTRLRWPLVYRYLARRSVAPTLPIAHPNTMTPLQKVHVLDLLLTVLRGHVSNQNVEGVTVKVSTIPQAGQGLFTTRSYSQGDLLCVYSGTSVSLTQALQRQEAGIHGDYVMGGFGLFWRVDAGPHPNVLARYINDPYLEPTKINVKFIKLKKYKIALVVAARDLISNEEIFATYGEGYWRKRT